MRDALIVNVLSVLPRERLARLMGWLTRRRLPRLLHRWLLRWFVAHYRVDMSEAEGGIDDYPSLAAFFVRDLKPGVRPLCEDPGAIASPADAQVAAFGKVTGDVIPQGGTHKASIREMLGGDHPFEGGDYAVLYLSPPDYHRVHAPVAGRVVRWSYLPGRLFPVFAACVEMVDGVFSRNERLVTWLDSEHGQVAVVMLGAFGVGRMSAVFTDLITNTGGAACDERPDDPPTLARGDELGRFHMGSTVILFFEPGRIQWELELGQRPRVKARIAQALEPRS
jgi:phosphatidylserine decarboxylase